MRIRRFFGGHHHNHGGHQQQGYGPPGYFTGQSGYYAGPYQTGYPQGPPGYQQGYPQQGYQVQDGAYVCVYVFHHEQALYLLHLCTGA